MYGSDGMSGTVYVNASGSLPPIAQMNSTPAVGVVGQAVTFSAATPTADTGRQTAKYEWDLDGDGTLETGPRRPPRGTARAPRP